MLKKLSALLVTVLLTACVTVPVFAADAGASNEYLSAKDTGFSYSHSPLDNPEAASDIIANPDAVYGYSPSPDSSRLAAYALNDWTDAVWVNNEKRERMDAYRSNSAAIDPALDACLGLYDYYYTAYVASGNAKAYSADDEAFVSGWGDNRPDDVLWAEYEDVYRNPKYYESSNGDIIWPADDGFWGESFDYTLQPYSHIDRYGSDYGTYVSIVGHPYEDYSLAPGSEYKNYSVFIVRKPINGRAGAVYPWFDEPGGATQVVLPSPVKDLMEDGSLERVYYR